MKYVMMNPTTGSIELLDKDSYVVPLNEDELDLMNDDELWAAADNTRMTVIPLIECLEDEEALPDFETVEAAGLDGTNRTGGPYTWRDVALKALETRGDMTLDENQRWYVRAMVIRGVLATQESTKDGQEWLDGEGKDSPSTFRSSIKGMIGYNDQVLREARQYVPEQLMPRD